MPQRTIQEARQHLDGLAEVMSPKALSPFQAEFDGAQTAAVDMATRHMDTTFAAVAALSDRVDDQVRDVRTGYARLIDEGQAGRITAREFNERFTKLRQQQRDAERRATEAARTAERLEAVELDPEGWADSLYQRFPLTRPHFSF